MFKISHEVPIQMLEESKKFNDYDYALVHVFERSKEYLDFYKKSLKEGRTVILDNSAYELGMPFDQTKYRLFIQELCPTEYILPDYRDNSRANLLAVKNWCIKNRDLGGRKIGVVHGNSYEDFCLNYRELKTWVDKIAFSAESFFKTYAENLGISFEESRAAILARMLESGIIDTSIDHHILGALSPTEYENFLGYDWIESVDTSNPVLHGLIGQQYQGEKGLSRKSETKLDSMMHLDVSEDQRKRIYYNVEWFKKNLTSHKVDEQPYDEVGAPHYRQQPIETIELMRRVYGRKKTADWCEITAFKYRMRIGHKPTTTMENDLKKEQWYLNKAKELRKTG
jgi:hypothetical protein